MLILDRKYKFKSNAPMVIRNKEFYVVSYSPNVNLYQIHILGENRYRTFDGKFVHYAQELPYYKQGDSKLIFKFL